MMSTKPGNPQRSERARRIGVVSSAARKQTIAVKVDFSVTHSKYGKIMRRSTTLHAHDEKQECRKGDTVEIEECRPLSKTKCWRLLRVVQRAPEQVAFVGSN